MITIILIFQRFDINYAPINIEAMAVLHHSESSSSIYTSLSHCKTDKKLGVQPYGTEKNLNNDSGPSEILSMHPNILKEASCQYIRSDLYGVKSEVSDRINSELNLADLEAFTPSNGEVQVFELCSSDYIKY